MGNLSWNTTDDGLAHAFSPYGQLTDYIVMKDRDTGRSRGFGFVTFMTQQEADAAIAALNEQELDGRRIRVNMANSRPPLGGMGGASLGYSGLTGGYGAGAYGAAQGGYGAFGKYDLPCILTQLALSLPTSAMVSRLATPRTSSSLTGHSPLAILLHRPPTRRSRVGSPLMEPNSPTALRRRASRPPNHRKAVLVMAKGIDWLTALVCVTYLCPVKGYGYYCKDPIL